MEVIEVNTKKLLKRFVQFPLHLYADSKHYIPVINSQELKTFNPVSNPLFNTENTKLWLAISDDNVVGRIAAILPKLNAPDDRAIAKFGWFDVIHDENVSNRLLDTAENFAVMNGISSIHGPLGFSTFDRSGALVEGFEEIPSIFSCYNFPYYEELILKAGYRKDYDWIEFKIEVPESIPQKITKGANIVAKRYGLSTLRINSIDDLKKIKQDILQVLNSAYQGLNGFKPLSEAYFDILFRNFSDILVPEFVSVVEDQQNNIIGFGLAVPSFSGAFKKMNGKLFPFGFINLIKAKRKIKVADMLLIAILPEYQKKGAHALIFKEIMQHLINKGVRQVESTKELEENNHIRNLWNGYEYVQHRRSRCFIKQL